MEKIKINAELTGKRPIMFDRYAGDNNTKLSNKDKIYIQDGVAVMPAINILSCLSAELTKSVAKVFHGKQWAAIARQVQCYMGIPDMYIPILYRGEKIPINGHLPECFEVHKHVARVKKGASAIPMPKERPVLNLPWSINLDIEIHDNPELVPENLYTYFCEAGMIGLGTFRPIYGQFEVTKWDVLK